MSVSFTLAKKILKADRKYISAFNKKPMQTVTGLDNFDRLDKRQPLILNVSFDRDDISFLPEININLHSRPNSEYDSDSSSKTSLSQAVSEGMESETEDVLENLCKITSKLMKIAEKFPVSGEAKKTAVLEAIHTHLQNKGCEKHKAKCIVKKVLPGLIDTIVNIDTGKISLKV